MYIKVGAYLAVEKIFSVLAQIPRFTITLHLEKLTLILKLLGNKLLYYSHRRNISTEAFVIKISISQLGLNP